MRRLLQVLRVLLGVATVLRSVHRHAGLNRTVRLSDGMDAMLPVPGNGNRARSENCPACGGSLGEPISGDVHCYVECARCGLRFELDDPRLVPPREGDSTHPSR